MRLDIRVLSTAMTTNTLNSKPVSRPRLRPMFSITNSVTPRQLIMTERSTESRVFSPAARALTPVAANFTTMATTTTSTQKTSSSEPLAALKTMRSPIITKNNGSSSQDRVDLIQPDNSWSVLDLGVMIPASSAPRIMCTPMASAASAAATSMARQARTSATGPSLPSSVARARRASNGRTTTAISTASATSNRTVRANESNVPPRARITTTASTSHAVTSQTAALPRPIVPIRVLFSPHSSRTLANTGNAVTLSARPRNNANAPVDNPAGWNTAGSANASRTPASRGPAMVPCPTITEMGPDLRSVGSDSSRPMTNMKRTTPSCAIASMKPSACGVKIATCRLGATAPSTDGPSTIPAAISPTRRG
nr:hypothetical protein [Actinophytocola sp.]